MVTLGLDAEYRIPRARQVRGPDCDRPGSPAPGAESRPLLGHCGDSARGGDVLYAQSSTARCWSTSSSPFGRPIAGRSGRENRRVGTCCGAWTLWPRGLLYNDLAVIGHEC